MRSSARSWNLLVRGHAEALQMLDRDIRAANNHRLRAHLIATHQTVTGHLHEAKRLQGDRETTRMSRR